MRDNQLDERVDRAPDPSLFAGVVLGNAIHDGRFLPGFAEYLQRHAAGLRQHPNGLFSIGMGPCCADPWGDLKAHATDAE
ncbi:hypothetical protein [Nocardia brasiliensis]|uniref:hypothetical protein n=1 Tax=Nocardia brasiliensis TaxID=37326 RepID=UPI003CC7DC70